MSDKDTNKDQIVQIQEAPDKEVQQEEQEVVSVPDFLLKQILQANAYERTEAVRAYKEFWSAELLHTQVVINQKTLESM